MVQGCEPVRLDIALKPATKTLPTTIRLPYYINPVVQQHYSERVQRPSF